MPAARFEMPRISSAGFPIVTARFGNTEEISRPTIMRISSAAIELVGAMRGDRLSVAKHGDPIGDGEDLLEAVRDVDHADAVAAEQRDDTEQALHLTFTQ